MVIFCILNFLLGLSGAPPYSSNIDSCFGKIFPFPLRRASVPDVSTCRRVCDPYDYVPCSIWSKVSCQVGIGLVALRGGGRTVSDCHLLKEKKKENKYVSISFTALIKGVITMPYLWLCLLSRGGGVFACDRSVNTRGNVLYNETNILCITV